MKKHKFTNALDFLNKKVEVVIDRPLGSKHPTHGFLYKSNYGHIPNTNSPDGEELDAYVLDINKPSKFFRGKCIAVIRRTNEDDDKLVVIPENKTLTDKQIQTTVERVIQDIASIYQEEMSMR